MEPEAKGHGMELGKKGHGMELGKRGHGRELGTKGHGMEPGLLGMRGCRMTWGCWGQEDAGPRLCPVPSQLHAPR